MHLELPAGCFCVMIWNIWGRLRVEEWRWTLGVLKQPPHETSALLPPPDWLGYWNNPIDRHLPDRLWGSAVEYHSVFLPKAGFLLGDHIFIPSISYRLTMRLPFRETPNCKRFTLYVSSDKLRVCTAACLSHDNSGSTSELFSLDLSIHRGVVSHPASA